jgi:ribonuclease HII
MILTGIDEAGYGPTLGPLVVTAVSLHGPDRILQRDLWDVLRQVATASARPRRNDPRLPICDSKKLHSGTDKLARLERTALAFLALSDSVVPTTFSALVAELCPDWPPWAQECPWFAGRDLDLPQAADRGDIRTHRAALESCLGGSGLSVARVAAIVLPAPRYNQMVAATRSKSAVLFWATTRLITEILATRHDESHTFTIDRQGGRIAYARELMRQLQIDTLHIAAEEPQASRYALTHLPRLSEVGFYRDGESRHLLIALASIISKYLRELCMVLFNRYWLEHVAGLRPTAGYYTDAQRFLAEVRPHLRRLRIVEGTLVRAR